MKIANEQKFTHNLCFAEKQSYMWRESETACSHDIGVFLRPVSFHLYLQVLCRQWWMVQDSYTVCSEEDDLSC
jgi:hypothetical protein